MKTVGGPAAGCKHPSCKPKLVCCLPAMEDAALACSWLTSGERERRAPLCADVGTGQGPLNSLASLCSAVEGDNSH